MIFLNLVPQPIPWTTATSSRDGSIWCIAVIPADEEYGQILDHRQTSTRRAKVP